MGEKLRLTVACGDYEIVRAIKEGAVKADGLDLVMLTGMGPRERHWRMARMPNSTSARPMSAPISWSATTMCH